MGRICAWCRCSWVIATCRRRKSIPTSPANASKSCINSTTRAGDRPLCARLSGRLRLLESREPPGNGGVEYLKSVGVSMFKILAVLLLGAAALVSTAGADAADQAADPRVALLKLLPAGS